MQCRVRNITVSETPEEIVRQNLLRRMIDEMGFPLGNIAVEKGLAQMPHLQLSNDQIPERRADIVCFANQIHPNHSLYPLLLIECKATLLNQKVINQVVGYNHFLQAYYIAIANGSEIQTGWYDLSKKKHRFINGLPSYSQLIREAKK